MQNTEKQRAKTRIWKEHGQYYEILFYELKIKSKLIITIPRDNKIKYSRKAILGVVKLIGSTSWTL